MGKILDSEFRKTLYKGLVDAGYEKEEAQKIVGIKYHGALKEDLLNNMSVLIASIENETYDKPLTEEFVNNANNAIEELKKMKEFLEKSS